MNNIKNLKVSKFFWKKIIYHEYGIIKVILVKKNLFKHYTIVDENGNKRKLSAEDLDYMLERLIPNRLDTSNTLSKSNSEANRRYQNYNYYIKGTHDYELNDQKDYYEGVIKGFKQNEKEMNETINSYEQQKKSSIYSRIISLKDDISNVFSTNVHSEGYNVEYQTPNQLQMQYFGITTVPVRIPYSNNNRYSRNLDYYFEILEKKIDKSLLNQTSRLKSMLNELKNKVSDLENNFSEDKYLQVVSFKTRFIISFSNFINSCIKLYGKEDISYYDTYTSYSRGDEESTTTISCDDLIATGRDICANLIAKYMGNSEKEQFMQTTAPEELTEELTEKPKTI